MPRREGVYSIDRLALEALRYLEGSATAGDEEEIARYKVDIFNRVDRACASLAVRGLQRPFEIVDRQRLLLRFQPFAATARGKLAEISASLAPLIFEGLSSLNEREYEFACGAACRLSGAKRAFVSPRGSDKNIDFVAIIPAYAKSPLICAGTDGLRIVGQAKKYADPCKVSEMKVHVQTMQDIRHRTPATVNSLPTWFFESRAPIIGWFVAHRGLQDGATTTARDHGIITTNSLELAQLFARPSTYGYVADRRQANSRLKTLIKEFHND